MDSDGNITQYAIDSTTGNLKQRTNPDLTTENYLYIIESHSIVNRCLSR